MLNRIALACLIAAPGIAQTRFEPIGRTHLLPRLDRASLTTDLDMDGDTDLLMSSGRAHLNDGNARFASIDIGLDLRGRLIAADFDSDGDVDIVRFWFGLAFFEQTAPLAFADTSGLRFPTMPTQFTINQLHPVDVDDDGDADILLEASREEPAVLLNDGTGTFSFLTVPADGPVPELATRSTAIADLDGDGDPDLARVANTFAMPNTAQIWLNDGAGNFTLDDQLPRALAKMLVVDYDGDSDVDVVALESTSGGNDFNVSLWKNDGTGSLVEDPNSFGIATSELDLDRTAILDADADGRPDVFVGPDTIFENRNGNTGIPHVIEELTSASESDGIAFATDFDTDGRDDLLLGAAGLFLNTPSAEPWARFVDVSPWRPDLGGARAAADVDGDGDLDLFLPPNSLQIQADDGTWQHRELPPQIGFDGAFADLDSDGDPDLIVDSALLINDGTGQFHLGSPLRLPATPFDWDSWVAADFDGDGHLDIGVRQFTDATILWNAGNGFFPATTVMAPSARVIDGAHAYDIDGDGDQDFLSEGIHVNQGSRTFTMETVERLPPGYFDLPFWLPMEPVGDFSGDGAVDMVIGIGIEIRNDGDGFFDYGISLPQPGVIAFLDYDMDGDVDLLASTAGGGGFNTLTNDGALNFTSDGTVLEGVIFSLNALIVDIDEDQDVDVILDQVVLINHATQLVAPFAPRVGTSFELRVEFGPSQDDTTRSVAMLLGLAPARISLFDWGDLRIDPLTLVPWASTQVLAPGESVATYAFPIPPQIPLDTLLFSQGLVIENGRVRFTNRSVDRVR